jgi:hypothetical protein
VSGRSVDLDNISNQEIQNAIDTWLHSARDRLILKLRLIDGLTYSQTVEYLYKKENIVLSERQVIRIVSRAEEILFRHL